MTTAARDACERPRRTCKISARRGIYLPFFEVRSRRCPFVIVVVTRSAERTYYYVLRRTTRVVFIIPPVRFFRIPIRGPIINISNKRPSRCHIHARSHVPVRVLRCTYVLLIARDRIINNTIWRGNFFISPRDFCTENVTNSCARTLFGRFNCF